jgi:hypothetical protein
MMAGDTPGYLANQIYKDLGVSAACFLVMDEKGRQMLPAGSGTFVKYGGCSEILTAALAHDNGVVSAIRTHGRRSVFGYAIGELMLGGKPATVESLR